MNMSDKCEQRYPLKFFIKLNYKRLELYHELKNVYGDACMKNYMCLLWHSEFRNGRKSCELEDGSEAPVTASIEEIMNTVGLLIVTDHCLTIRELSHIPEISLGNIHTILHDHLYVSRVCACWILRLLCGANTNLNAFTQ